MVVYNIFAEIQNVAIVTGFSPTDAFLTDKCYPDSPPQAFMESLCGAKLSNIELQHEPFNRTGKQDIWASLYEGRQYV